MADETDLKDLKRRLSGRLMAIDGVSGVGVGADRIQVYLAQDDDRVRAEVERVIEAESPGIAAAYITTGPFRAQ